MKKRISALLSSAIIATILVGCSSADSPTSTSSPTTPPVPATSEAVISTEEPTTATTNSTAPDETIPVVSITGDTLTLGNLKFTIPDTFIVSKIEDNTVLLTSPDKDCSIGLFAADISELDEAKAQTYLPLQHNSFVTSDQERVNENVLDALIGGFDVKMNIYGEIRSNNSAVSCMNTTFTDSWYAYTILSECNIESENLDSYVDTFIEFIGYSKYNGDNPRFDFVQ